MSSNENTGSIPKASPETAGVLHGTESGPDQHPKEQPVTSAGGILGPLETIVEKTEKTKTEEK